METHFLVLVGVFVCLQHPPPLLLLLITLISIRRYEKLANRFLGNGRTKQH